MYYNKAIIKGGPGMTVSCIVFLAILVFIVGLIVFEICTGKIVFTLEDPEPDKSETHAKTRYDSVEK